MPISLVVDPVECDAFGYCAEILSEHVTLDEWGYPVVAEGPLPRALVDRAAQAARLCPRRALLLAVSPGEEIPRGIAASAVIRRPPRQPSSVGHAGDRRT